MANSSISFTSLDFDSYKASLKAFLKEQKAFKDYDYESSNINVLLDILAYNTYQNAFYLNMVGNEMFLDSAQLRDSVVSHAKELNYMPRSYRASQAEIGVTIVASDPTKRNITIPRGTGFTTRMFDKTFIFTTDENVVVTSDTNTFTTSLKIYEGDLTTDTYVINYNFPSRYIINNKNVDISSVKVTVVEDNGATVQNYSRATSLFDLNSLSKIFFVQPYINDTYEVIFGDGIIGRTPKNNSIIIIEYRMSNGELPNGARIFNVAENIDGENNITVRTVSVATGGTVYESLESIKYNAPRAFTTQERAVTAEDYENLLKINYPEINAVTAFGGEDADPPQYGRIFISVDLNDVDGLPLVKQNEYKSFLRTRSTVSMEPVFIDPEYLYIKVNSLVKYSVNRTELNPDDIRALVLSSILNYSANNLNKFARTLRYSRLVQGIDAADASVISNETNIKLIKYLTPKLNTLQALKVKFTVPLINDVPNLGSFHPAVDAHAIYSTPFVYEGKTCILEDNGDGIIRIVTVEGINHKKIIDIGTVNYDTGEVSVNNFKISAFTGPSFKIYGVPRSKDIKTDKNIILNILEPDIIVDIEQVRE